MGLLTLLEQHIQNHHQQKMEEQLAKDKTNQYLVEQGVQGNLPDDQWQTALADLTKTPTDHGKKAKEDAAQVGADMHILTQGMRGAVEPSIWQPALDRITKHPALKDHAEAIRGAVARITTPKAPAPVTPAPAAPGQTPGTLSSLIGGNRDAQGVAQPSTSPVQPGAPQMAPLPGAVGFSQPTQAKELAAPPVLPPVGAPEQTQQTQQSSILPPPPVGSVAPTTKAGPYNVQDPQAIKEKYHPKGVFQNPAERAIAETGYKTELAQNQKLWETLASHHAAGQAIKDIFGTEGGRDWAKVTPAQWMLSSAAGVPLPPMLRGMASAIYNPYKTEEDAATLERQHPGILKQYNIDPKSTPKVIVSRSRTAIAEGDDTPIAISGSLQQMGTGFDANGNGILVPKVGTPGQQTGAVSTAQSAPHVYTDKSGGQFTQSAASVAAGGQGKVVPNAQNPLFAPVSRSNTEIREAFNPVTKQNELTAIPVVSSSQRTGGAGGSGAGVPRPIAISAGEGRREQENPLTPAAQSIVMSTKPAITMVDRALVEMKKMGMDNSATPGTTLLPRLAYALGYGTDQGRFLADLSMDSLVSAGSLLKTTGGQRSIVALQKALVHTPEAWKDSGKLMYDKMRAIKDRLQEVEKVARGEGKKYPGMVPVGASGAQGDPLGIR